MPARAQLVALAVVVLALVLVAVYLGVLIISGSVVRFEELHPIPRFGDV